MRRADRLCAYFLRGRSQSPAKVIQTRRGQRFRRVFFSPWWGFSPAGAFCRPPTLFACRLRGGSVLHFLFPCGITPGFIFLSSCGFPAALCAVSVSLAWAYGVSRGGWACISGRQRSRLGASGAAVGRSGSRRGRRRSGRVRQGQADFLRGSALIAPPGLPGVCLPASKSLGQSRRKSPRKSQDLRGVFIVAIVA